MTYCKECFLWHPHFQILQTRRCPRSRTLKSQSPFPTLPHSLLELSSWSLPRLQPQCCRNPLYSTLPNPSSVAGIQLTSALVVFSVQCIDTHPPGNFWWQEFPLSSVQCYDPCVWGLLNVALEVSVWTLVLVHMLWKTQLYCLKSLVHFDRLSPLPHTVFLPRNNIVKTH